MARSSSSSSSSSKKSNATMDMNKIPVCIREFDSERDVEAVEAVERLCEVGPSGSFSLFTDLLGDPLGRIRHCPSYLMLVAESGNSKMLLGVVRGSIKNVVCHENQPKFRKVGYILGLRVHPSHRRMGIALRLVETMVGWMKEEGAEYAYMATDKSNKASINLFVEKCRFLKFRRPAILAHPVHAHSKRISKDTLIERLSIEEAVDAYRQAMGQTEFFPQDIADVLANKLCLGTWIAFRKSENGEMDHGNMTVKKNCISWAIVSLWDSACIFRLQVKGLSASKCMVSSVSRALDKYLPWLRVPSIPDVWRPFGVHVMFGMQAQGPNGMSLMKDLWSFCHNIAKNSHGVRLIASEVACRDPLKDCLPHWPVFSVPEDLWCIKNLRNHDDDEALDNEEDEAAQDAWIKSKPPLSTFVDPRDF